MPKELAFFNKTHEIWLGRYEGFFVCRLLHCCPYCGSLLVNFPVLQRE